MWRRLALLWVALLAVGGVLSGCAAGEAEPVLVGEPTDELRLGLTEWSIETGGAQLLPGEVQVTVTNTGGTGHDVVIHGEQGTWGSPVLAPGETHELVITAVPGEQLHLVCTLTGHETQGMHTRIDVVEER